MKSSVRVGVVDCHPLFRDGIVLALSSEPDLKVAGQGASSSDALRICRESSPDVLVIDAALLGRGIDVLDAIRQGSPQTSIAILADAIGEESVHAALRRGVRGYLLKCASRAELIQAVRTLHQGQSFLSPGLAAKLLMSTAEFGSGDTRSRERLPRLTPREEQILSILVKGRSNKEIGNTLDLSEKTIKHHLTHILQKLRVRNRVEAALVASSRMPQDPHAAKRDAWPHVVAEGPSRSQVKGDKLLAGLA